MFCCPCLSSIMYFVGLAAIATTLGRFVLSLCGCCCRKKPQAREKHWKKDVVYLYQFHGTSTMPSISPFCIKVEGFLRLHKIAFERRYVFASRGINGKVPFIELNGEQIADSHLILKRLAEHFSIKNANGYASAEEAAVGHALGRLADNHLFHIIAKSKLTEGAPIAIRALASHDLPPWLLSIVTSLPLATLLRGRTRAFGSFTDAEYTELLEEDLDVFKTQLGNKKFFFGDNITEADLALFGHYATMMYLGVNCKAVEILCSEKYATLRRHTERLRTQLFGADFHDD